MLADMVDRVICAIRPRRPLGSLSAARLGQRRAPEQRRKRLPSASCVAQDRRRVGGGGSKSYPTVTEGLDLVRHTRSPTRADIVSGLSSGESHGRSLAQCRWHPLAESEEGGGTHDADCTVTIARRMPSAARILRQTRRDKENAFAHGFALTTGDIAMIHVDSSSDEILQIVTTLFDGADFANGNLARDWWCQIPHKLVRSLGDRLLNRFF
jgi:hypothetical protein